MDEGKGPNPHYEGHHHGESDELRGLRFEDCPHAAPHRYCAECPVKPCPIGLGKP